MRSRLPECQRIESQSVDTTTARPPGLKTRYVSASAASTSATYSNTCTDTAASKLPSSAGSSVALPS